MFPIRDENRSKTTPHITRILIVVNFLAFIPLLFAFFSGDTTVNLFANWVYDNFVLVPAEILEGNNLHTLFTSMFLHADIFHIGGNLLYLYVFGDNVEDAFGHFRFLLFYFVCGIVANLVHILSITVSTDLLIPTLGASGAISGVMGAYILLYPRARIETLIIAIFVSGLSVHVPQHTPEAEASVLPYLPGPTKLIEPSPAFNLPRLHGIKLYPHNPFKFDFIIEEGDKTPNLRAL